MSIRENPHPTGKTDLVDYFHETSSGHYDESKKVSLIPGQGTLIEMTVFTDSCDQFRGPRTEKSECWIIERDALIDLIKKHGRRK